MIVRAMSVQRASVRGMFRDNREGMSVRGPLNRGLGMPSEGRGQRFESSWVRHDFQTFCPCYRPRYPLLFTRRSAQGMPPRSGAMRRHSEPLGLASPVRRMRPTGAA
jgi:hypothetical protein